MKRIARLFALSTLLLAAGLAHARVVYVNANAPGPAHDGASWATAYQDVEQGVSAAAAGDEVWVARGVYRTSVAPGAGVALYGGFAGTEAQRQDRNWRANETVLDGTGADAPVVSCSGDGAVVDGFTIRNGVCGVYIASSGTAGPVVIARNTICRNSSAGVRVHAGAATLSGNTVSDNWDYGVAVESPVASTLRDNTVSGSRLEGVRLFQEGQASLVNNTICANGGSGLHVESTNLPAVSNNIFASNGMFGVMVPGGALATYAHNDAWGNAYGATLGECYGFQPEDWPGNISADPRLSSLYHDIHLQPGSPCQDAGDNVGLASYEDIDGQPRVQGAHVDMGSDESDGTTWTVPSIAWRVSSSGSDQADGHTWGTAKRTVAAALLEARGGDEVWVAGGVYPESLRPTAGVALTGGFAGTETDRAQRDWTAHPTVLDGGASPGNVVECRGLNTIVDGFQIRNGGYGAYVYGSAVLANNRFSGSAIYGAYVSGTAALTRNAFTGCANGVYITGAATLEGNTICNVGNGVYVDMGTAWLTGNTLASSETGAAVRIGTMTMVNNTVTGNITGVDVQGMASLTNNVVAFNSGTGVSLQGGEIWAFSHNDMYGNAADFARYSPPDGQGNISLDPRLSNPYGDVHIQPDSPCIDAGQDTDAAGFADIDGEPRVQGARVDIGSDESDGTAWDATPAIWHVSPTGDDAQDGRTWATARRTISAALRSAKGLDEVWVSEGTYAESIALPTAVSLTGGFAGAESDRGQRDPAAHPTVLDGGGARRAVYCQFPTVTLDGFTVRNAETGVYVAAGAALSSLALTDNHVGAEIWGASTLTDSLIAVNATGLRAWAPLTLERCTVSGNSEAGVNAAYGGSVDGRGNTFADNAQYGALGTQTGYLTLTGNTFSGNGVGAAATDFASAALSSNVFSANGTGAYLSSRNVATLTNNTLCGSLHHGVLVAGAWAAMANNIVAFGEGDGISVSGDGAAVPSFSHNDVFGNKAGDFAGFAPPDGSGSISLDPLFADLANGDFRLKPGSPCIDAGDSEAVAPGATDIDGRPRILGARVDLGAYETAASVPVLTDVVAALKIAAGLIPATAADASRLNADPSSPGVDLLDAVRIIRTFGI